jgi:hypothetical protein
MTDDRPPIDSSDEELVSAYLDDEATSVERERVEADPQLLALVDSYRSAAEAVGSPVMPLDQPRRDAMVATALAVLDDLDDEVDDEEPGSAAKVVPLSGRRRWISRAPGLAAAAAILFLVGIGLVLSSNGSDRDQQADNVSASAEQESTSGNDLESKGAPGDAAEDGDTGGSAPAATPGDASGEALAAGPDPVDLGAFTDQATLRQALATNPPSTDSFARESEDAADPDAEESRPASRFESEADRCADVVTTTDSELGDLVAVRTATLAGEPVLIFSHTERDEPDRTIDTVTDRESCQILFAQAR